MSHKNSRSRKHKRRLTALANIKTLPAREYIKGYDHENIEHRARYQAYKDEKAHVIHVLCARTGYSANPHALL